jgi:serine/threonine protein phosphatase PrpC
MSGRSLRFVDAARTDTGRVRSANEDSFVGAPQLGLWAVADGMGGHVNGAWASRAVADSLMAAPLAGAFEPDSLRLADAIHAANAKVHAESTAIGKPMGSTVAALLLRDESFAVLWAGDSRVYLLREGILYRLTRDHTQVQEMVDRGLLTPEEAVNHPMSHVITRAVGVQGALEVDAIADQPLAGDVFLLCSDGLYGVVSDDEIGAHLRVHRPAAACERLVDLCLERGAPDNVTVIAVACDQTTLLTRPSGEEASTQ